MATKISTGATITDANIKLAAAWLTEHYKAFSPTHGASAYALLVAHATNASTHGDAQIVAARYLEIQGLPASMLSTNSCWHSVRRNVARRRSSAGKQRYDANAKTAFGGAIMFCTTAKHGYKRDDCTNTCLQGLAVDGKLLASIVTKVSRSIKKQNEKVIKRSGVAKGKGKKAIANAAQALTDRGELAIGVKPENVQVGGSAPIVNPNDVTNTAKSVD